ncbi:hypothetical protein [Keratinibaculum paraultunense]|nr:hypothetical protein [Keratinibaculum paraultunense]QQY79532.1 hypothetical protein JL105_10125 [Keratinibaculum paraultunense]
MECFSGQELQEEVREITAQQYRWLIEGLSIDQKNAIQKLDNKRII